MRNVLFFLLCCSLFFSACSKEESKDDIPVAELSFQLSVSEQAETSARIEIVPSDPSATYYYSVMPKEEFEALGDDASLQQHDLESFAEQAEQEGKNLSQIISYLVTNGQVIKKIENLTSDTDYCLYVYSLDENRNAGKVYTSFFTTSPEVKSGFNISIDKVGHTNASVTIAPTRDDMTYYYSVVYKSTFDEQIFDDDVLVEQDQEKFRNDAVNQNKFLDEYLSEVLVQGKKTVSLENLRPRTGFYVYVYGLNTRGEVTTSVFKEEFVTQEPERVEASFELSVDNIASSSATIRVTPSSDNVRYYVDYMVKYVYDNGGGNSQVIEESYYENLALSEKIGGSDHPIDAIVEEMSNFGASSHDVLRLMTETEYVVYAFAIDAWGNIVSDVYTETFTTTAVVESDLQFSMDVVHHTDKVVITVTPSDPAATYIFDFCYGSDIDRYDNDKDIINMILSFSFDIVSGTQVYEYPKPFNEDKFYALAFGYSKETGPNTKVFKEAVYNDGHQE